MDSMHCWRDLSISIHISAEMSWVTQNDYNVQVYYTIMQKHRKIDKIGEGAADRAGPVFAPDMCKWVLINTFMGVQGLPGSYQFFNKTLA